MAKRQPLKLTQWKMCVNDTVNDYVGQYAKVCQRGPEACQYTVLSICVVITFTKAKWGVAEWIERRLLMLEVQGSNPGYSA